MGRLVVSWEPARSTIVFGRKKENCLIASAVVHWTKSKQKEEQQQQEQFCRRFVRLVLYFYPFACTPPNPIHVLFKPTLGSWPLILFLTFPWVLPTIRCFSLLLLLLLREGRRFLVPVSAIRHVSHQSFRGHLGLESTTVQIDFLSAPFCLSLLVPPLYYVSFSPPSDHHNNSAKKEKKIRKKKRKDHHMQCLVDRPTDRPTSSSWLFLFLAWTSLSVSLYIAINVPVCATNTHCFFSSVLETLHDAPKFSYIPPPRKSISDAKLDQPRQLS